MEKLKILTPPNILGKPALNIEYKIENNILKIYIPYKGKLFETFFDKKDLNLLQNYRLRLDKGCTTYYVVATHLNNPCKPLYIHRILLNAKSNQFVDHKNRNGLDNQRKNLRLCTKSKNNANQPPSLNIKKTSKYKGVSWGKIPRKWLAFISVNNKTKRLGAFNTQEEAALCYNETAKNIFGEFAYLNEVEKNV